MKRSAPENRRMALILAAYRAIAKKGFEGLRLRHVATQAGIDHSTLHHHFRTKQDLIAAVLDYATEQFRPAPSSSGTPPTSLKEHLAFLGQMIADRPELHVVLREFDLRATRDARVRAIIAQRENGWRERLVARIQDAALEGHWPASLDASIGAELVIAVVKGSSFNPKSGVDILSLFEHLLSICESGVRTPKRNHA